MANVEELRYNGGAEVYAWKYPGDSFRSGTQLIVNESQEAVLFRDGIAWDLFPSGRYELNETTMPLLSGAAKLPFGRSALVQAEVWFVNKAYILDIKWGTATPIQLQDPRYGVFIPLRSYGQFGVRIADAKKFLIKLVGTMASFDKDHMLQYFRGVYMTRVKDALSSYLVHQKVSILEINAYLEELSFHSMDKISPSFAEFGIELVNFYVSDVSVPEDDPAVQLLKDALARKAEIDIIGYDPNLSCGSCGKAIPVNGARFCPFCGKSLAD